MWRGLKPGDADLVACAALPGEAVGVNPLSRSLVDEEEGFSENGLRSVVTAQLSD